jgi:DNA-binding SARP family transcriptional activator
VTKRDPDPREPSQASKRRIVLLGGGAVTSNGQLVEMRGREKDLLAILAIRRSKPLGGQALAESFWLNPPATAIKTLQNYVARVRQHLGDDAIETIGRSYALNASWQTDVAEFENHCALAELSRRLNDFESERAQLALAIELVASEPLSSLEATPMVTAERVRLSESIEAAREFHLIALIELGRLREATPLAATLLHHNPSNERLWLLHAISLARSGERRAALETIQRGRKLLRNEAGIVAGAATNRLESLILTDDSKISSESVCALIDSYVSARVHTTAGDQFFVGRTSELAIVQKARATVIRSNQPSMVPVSGSMGSGRSVFSRRASLLAQADGWLCLHGNCRAGAIRPLEPFGDLAGEALQQTTQRRSAAVTKHSRTLSAIQDRFADRQDLSTLSSQVVSFFAELALEQPLMLVIDDADKLQPTSALILQQLCGERIPLLVIMVGGQHGAFDHFVEESVTLQPLSSSESRQLYAVLTVERDRRSASACSNTRKRIADSRGSHRFGGVGNQPIPRNDRIQRSSRPGRNGRDFASRSSGGLGMPGLSAHHHTGGTASSRRDSHSGKL